MIILLNVIHKQGDGSTYRHSGAGGDHGQVLVGAVACLTRSDESIAVTFDPILLLLLLLVIGTVAVISVSRFNRQQIR